jgi:RNA polymerase sigma factor (sigma-70 family)
LDNFQNLIKGCISNDRSSQEKLYRQFYPGLYALCKKFFNDDHDIITSLNNGMLNVFKNIGQFDPEKGDLFNWAYTIVRNAAITYFNSKKNVHPTIAINEYVEQSAFYSPFKELEWKEIYFYLDKLPPATRTVCTLHYLEGYAIKEIAEQLKLSEGTIKWHLSESRNKLKTNIITHPNF